MINRLTTYNETTSNSNLVDMTEYKLLHGLNGDEITYESQGLAVMLKFPIPEKSMTTEEAEESVSSVLKFELRNRMQK